jgi:hypothetical protein
VEIDFFDFQYRAAYFFFVITIQRFEYIFYIFPGECPDPGFIRARNPTAFSGRNNTHRVGIAEKVMSVFSVMQPSSMANNKWAPPVIKAAIGGKYDFPALSITVVDCSWLC